MLAMATRWSGSPRRASGGHRRAAEAFGALRPPLEQLERERGREGKVVERPLEG